VYEFARETSVPGKDSQRFMEAALQMGIKLVRTTAALKVSANGAGVKIEYQANGKSGSVDVDMAVLASAIEPDPGAADLAKLLGIETDSFGFFRIAEREPASATRPGVFIAGCNGGPKDMQTVVIQAQAAAAGVLRLTTGAGDG
jgi:heterodisulfide reductase subunit A